MTKPLSLILNPQAGDGYAGRIEPEITRCLATHGLDYEITHTLGPGHATQLASEAVRNGRETIVAVGGDGTSNEVVNGLLGGGAISSAINFGCIPAGSGNDFSAMNGVPATVEAACALIATRETHRVDVARIIIDGLPFRYCVNTTGIGFDALVTMETKRRPNARGLALYLPAVLRTIFITLNPMHVDLALDGVRQEMDSLMLTVGNGAREGHTFLVTPHALCDDGLLDVLLVGTMSRLSMLALLPRFFDGSHLSHRKISERRCRQMTLHSGDPMPVHIDGEVITTDAHDIQIEIVSQALCMLKPAQSTLV